MRFNFKNFVRFAYKTLFESESINYRLTPKRIGILALAYAIYIPVEILIWIGLKLDNYIFDAYRKTEVIEPVFIIGNPRSGTTLLHRLLAKDEHNFSTMKTWEIFLSPSVTMRKVVYKLILPLDRFFGYPFSKLVRQVEQLWQANNTIHKFSLLEPEEDEYLLLHIFSNLKIWLFVAMLEEAQPYIYFDSKMGEKRKQGFMNFYTRCLQRHLFFHNVADKHYLSKNPHFSPMVQTLSQYFPDIKIIYLARNPLDMIPSNISLKEEEWQLLGEPLEEYKSKEFILEMAQHWYRYPLAWLENLPPYRYHIINFNTLVNDVEETVTKIYDRFGLKISASFSKVLKQATEKARTHESKHEYSLQAMGLTREEIIHAFQDIYERFGFETREPEN